MDGFIGVDVGTGSVRAGLIIADGTIIEVASSSVIVTHPVPGYAVSSGENYYAALIETVSFVAKHAKNINIRGIAVGATGSSVVCSSKHGELLSEVTLWMDDRSAEEAEFLTRETHEFTSSEWLPSKSLWIKSHDVNRWKDSYYVTELLDWINFKLSDQWVCSQCNVTCKWNDKGTRWSSNAEHMMDVFTKTPNISKKTGEAISLISENFANMTGLPRDTILVQGGIDAYLSMVATGGLVPGILSMTLGTSTVLLTSSLHPKQSDSVWGPFYEPLVKEAWVIEGGQISSGSVLNWIQDLCHITHEDLSHQAQVLPPSADNLIMLENLQGNRTPHKDANARGSIVGLRLGHTPAHLYLAAMEATAMGIREAIEAVEACAGVEMDVIRLSGGGSCNRTWVQIHSDVLKRTLYIPEFPQHMGLIGAAMVASVGSGIHRDLYIASSAMAPQYQVVQPRLNRSVLYEKMMNARRKLYRATNEITTLVCEASGE